MKPNATPANATRAVLAAGAVLLCAPLPAAATLQEPALRLAMTLTPPAAGFPADERALLRAEFHAAQSRDAEADMVGDILARVRRINGMIGDIQGMMAAWPVAGTAMPGGPPPAAAKATTLPPNADEAGDAPTSNATLALRALMASVIIFLFWLLGKRHNYIKAQRIRATASPAPAPETVIPVDDALVAMPPPPAAAEQGRGPLEHEDLHHLEFTAVAPLPTPEPAVPLIPPAAAIEMSAPLEFVISDELAAPAAERHPPGAAPGTDQSLELAEIMVSMGLAQGAADALTEHIRANPKRALYHWLKLLDVYRRSQMKGEFERVAAELRQTFNVKPAAWGADAGSFSLEDFPHLVDKLLQLWPTPACADFLAGLLEDNRGGTRNGLPQCVAEEVLLLEHMLNAEAAAGQA